MKYLHKNLFIFLTTICIILTFIPNIYVTQNEKIIKISKSYTPYYDNPFAEDNN